jgi:hypothetical protein
MPFTGSHVAAVIPLFGTRLIPSGLVIGSMSPDLPYFLPVPVSSALTHSAEGVVSADVALGALVFALWVTCVAPVLVALSPARLRDRLAPGLPVAASHHTRSPAATVAVLASLAVGACTHVVWDAFTHPDRWGEQHVAWLSLTHGALPGYRWAQYASGLFGAAAIAAASLRWWLKTPLTPYAQRIPSQSRGTTLRAIAIIVACGGGGAAAGLVSGLGSDHRRVGFLAITWGIGAGLAALLAVVAVCYPGVKRRIRRPSERPL